MCSKRWQTATPNMGRLNKRPGGVLGHIRHAAAGCAHAVEDDLQVVGTTGLPRFNGGLFIAAPETVGIVTPNGVPWQPGEVAKMPAEWYRVPSSIRAPFKLSDLPEVLLI